MGAAVGLNNWRGSPRTTVRALCAGVAFPHPIEDRAQPCHADPGIEDHVAHPVNCRLVSHRAEDAECFSTKDEEDARTY